MSLLRPTQKRVPEFVEPACIQLHVRAAAIAHRSAMAIVPARARPRSVLAAGEIDDVGVYEWIAREGINYGDDQRRRLPLVTRLVRCWCQASK